MLLSVKEHLTEFNQIEKLMKGKSKPTKLRTRQ